MVTDEWNGPRLPGYIRPSDRLADRFLSVWCQYCGTLHHHGEGAGHRVAHCSRETPYTAKGYYVVDMGQDLPPGAMSYGDKGHHRVWRRIYQERRARAKGRVLPAYQPLSVPDWGREL